MAPGTAATADAYVAQLPVERQEAIVAVRRVILENLPPGYQETMQYGMISYVIPLERYPKTYNGQPLAYVSLASQKNYMSLYLMCVYGDTEVERWFAEGFRAAGKKLNMGKSCVRFKKIEDLPMDLIGETIARMPVPGFIAIYEASRSRVKSR
jgi:hypothetical protein